MSCLFCNSVYHLSHNCNQYPSAESRIVFFKDKNTCPKCTFTLCWHESRFCNLKCYACFSNQHNTYFCQQINDSNLFTPKIDAVLITRFLQSLYPHERISMACTNPNFPSKFLLRKLQVLKEYFYVTDSQFENCDIIANGTVEFTSFNYPNYFTSAFENLLNRNTVMIKARILKLLDILQISPKIFFQLLTPFAKELTCKNVTFESPIQFAEILAKIPNIEKMELIDTNVKLENSWPVDLLRENAGRSLKKITLEVDTFDFDAHMLAEFMKTKDDVKIVLRVFANYSCILAESFGNFKAKMLQFFDLDISKVSCKILQISFIFKEPGKPNFNQTIVHRYIPKLSNFYRHDDLSFWYP